MSSPLNLDRPCEHPHFDALVNVGRIGTGDTPDGMPAAYVAEVTVKCGECGEPFRWSGVRAGLSYVEPMCSPDETELRAPMRPRSADPDFGMGLPGFAIETRDDRADQAEAAIARVLELCKLADHGQARKSGFAAAMGALGTGDIRGAIEGRTTNG